MNDWKDFFYLSIGERRALILLLILIAIGLILLIWGDILYDRQQAAAPVATERTDSGESRCASMTAAMCSATPSGALSRRQPMPTCSTRGR